MITGHFYQCSINWHSVGVYMKAILKNTHTNNIYMFNGELIE